MIEQIINFLLKCPVLEKSGINVNYLDGKAGSYSLESRSGHSVIKRYADGGVLCEKRFVLASRRENSAAYGSNVKVAHDCEQIEAWICEQSEKGLLPQTDKGVLPCLLEIVKGFAVTHTASVDVRIEAELKFVFYTDKKALV